MQVERIQSNLIQACAVAVECGATTLNIPDTVGYVMPSEWADTLEMLINETPGAGALQWSDLVCALSQ